MSLRRTLFVLPFALAAVLVATGFVALVRAAPTLQPGTEASGCLPELTKSVDPGSLVLGETAAVSMVVSGTCPTRYLPVDLIIVADESNSMTRGTARAAEPATKVPEPNPSGEPPPPPEPGPIVTPGGPPRSDPRGSEPPFCQPGGGITLPPVEPTSPKPPEPGPGDPPPPPPGPGPIVPPSTSIVDPGPNIDELEPPAGFDWVREEKSWIRDFMGQPEIERDIASGRLRVGFVSFNERARIRQPITDSGTKIVGAANRMRGGEVTYIQQGMRAAEQMLRGSGSRKDVERVQLVILMSDFQFCQRDMRRIDKDLELIAVGFGVRPYDTRKMYDLATERRLVFQPRDLRGVVKAYEEIVARGRPVQMAELTVRERLSDNMRLVPDSQVPPTATVASPWITWTLQSPTLPLTLSYAVEPLEPGRHLVSAASGIDWRDSEGLLGKTEFPTVSIEVLAPTPTPTNTPTITPSPTATVTPSPTHTPTPAPRYLPVAYRDPRPTPEPTATVCVPAEQTVDVALVIDTSTSMQNPTRPGGTRKLDAAIDAAVGLVTMLKPDDQSAVVWFNDTSGLAAMLTSDKPTAIAALRGLPATTAPGTALHLGLRQATRELQSERHHPDSDTAIVLLTDGRQSHADGVQAVRDAAAEARAAGITVLTVGLGSDVDHELLRDVASEPELYFHAPDADDLEEIYIRIVDLIPCR